MSDELNEPLGLEGPARNGPLSRLPAAAPAILIFALVLAGFAAAVLPRDPFGAEPYAAARIEAAGQPSESRSEPAPQPPIGPARSPGGLAGESASAKGVLRDHVADTSEIEQRSGVKVTRSGSPDAPGALIIQLDRPAGIRLPPAPDKRLLEQGRYGPLPKIGSDGAKPMEVYARPVSLSPKLKPGAPKIALVVGGVGLSPQLSARAIDELPEAVSLAFAPYGPDLETLAARARDRGHEILLQAPMEPFDYPQNDPGPHTLLTAAQNGGELDDLHWLMSRFAGYVGIANFLGARFTADERALTPALAEIAARGLFFLDDGTSPQSLVSNVAPRLMLPAARADLVIDAKGTPEAADAALARLETLARQNGAAIGFANALPQTIARLARFARDLERRGLALVPVSAMVASPDAPQTRTGRQK